MRECQAPTPAPAALHGSGSSSGRGGESGRPDALGPASASSLAAPGPAPAALHLAAAPAADGSTIGLGEPGEALRVLRIHATAPGPALAALHRSGCTSSKGSMILAQNRFSRPCHPALPTPQPALGSIPAQPAHPTHSHHLESGGRTHGTLSSTRHPQTQRRTTTPHLP